MSTSARQPYQASTPISYIAHESEEMVHVRRAELRYWAKEVMEVIKNPLEGASAWAATCLGIAVSAALAGIGLLATEDKTHKVVASIYLVVLTVTIGFGGIAAFSWWVDRKQRQMRGGRAGSLAAQITAADTRSPRDPAAAAEANLDVWLEERSSEIVHLKNQLEAQIAATFDYEDAALIERMFWRVSEDVMRRLHLAAPEHVTYYKQNPDWWVGAVVRIQPEQFQDVIRMMDYTRDQIAHIRAELGK
jgi:hypothetical protein